VSTILADYFLLTADLGSNTVSIAYSAPLLG